MTYQYQPLTFGSQNQGFQLGNNFSEFGGNNGVFGANGNGLGVPGGLDQGGQGFFGGMNGLDLGRLGLGLANSGFNIYSGLQANKLAREQFRFTRDVTNTNLNNNIQSYNTQIEDRARARGAVEGQTADQVQGYIDRNRLSRG